VLGLLGHVGGPGPVASLQGLRLERRWFPIPHRHHQGDVCPWRQHGPGQRAAVQHAGLPGQLPGRQMVGVVGLLGHVRRRFAEADTGHHHATGERWCGMPRLDAIAKVQHPALPHQLRGGLLDGLVGLHGPMWTRIADAGPSRDHPACPRRRGLSGLHGNSGVQHAIVPG